MMISLPDDVLAQLDARAEHQGKTRSGLIRELVEADERRLDAEQARLMREISAELPPSRYGGDVVEALRAARQERLEKLTPSSSQQ